MSIFHEPQPELAPVRAALAKLLADIASSAVTVRCMSSRRGLRIFYETSNGWKLLVFNDAGHWDYLESAEDPSGQVLDFSEIQAVDCVDWESVARLRCWGRLRNHWDVDPEFPDG